MAHPSAAQDEKLKSDGTDNLMDIDLVITSYGYLARLPWLSSAAWRIVVLDEARRPQITFAVCWSTQPGRVRAANLPGSYRVAKPRQI